MIWKTQLWLGNKNVGCFPGESDKILLLLALWNFIKLQKGLLMLSSGICMSITLFKKRQKRNVQGRAGRHLNKWTDTLANLKWGQNWNNSRLTWVRQNFSNMRRRLKTSFITVSNSFLLVNFLIFTEAVPVNPFLMGAAEGLQFHTTCDINHSLLGDFTRCKKFKLCAIKNLTHLRVVLASSCRHRICKLSGVSVVSIYKLITPCWHQNV